MKCPRCESESVVKHGTNRSGSQRYLCKTCGRHFTPQPNPMGYPPEIRRQAVEMVLDGQGFRSTARSLRVNHQSVANWFNAAAARAAVAPIPQPPTDENTIVEADELFTFVGNKKRAPTWSRKSNGRRVA